MIATNQVTSARQGARRIAGVVSLGWKKWAVPGSEKRDLDSPGRPQENQGLERKSKKSGENERSQFRAMISTKALNFYPLPCGKLFPIGRNRPRSPKTPSFHNGGLSEVEPGLGTLSLRDLALHGLSGDYREGVACHVPAASAVDQGLRQMRTILTKMV